MKQFSLINDGNFKANNPTVRLQNIAKWKRVPKLLLFMLFFTIFVLIFFYRHSKMEVHLLNDIEDSIALDRKDNVEEIANGKWRDCLMEPNLSQRIPPQFDKFILTENMDGGLGNQMFRFASLYAMGQMLGRTAVYSQDENIMHSMEEEMANTFPEFHKRNYFLKTGLQEGVEKVNFANGCCKYANPEKLLTTNNQSVALQLLGGPNFENYMYFNHMRDRILKLFKCHPNIVEKIETLKKEKFGDFTHKLCIHTRVGDFKPLGESKNDQVSGAIEYMRRVLPRIKKIDKGISLLAFGSDKNFLNTIRILNNESIESVHHIIDLKLARGEEICLASMTCDSLLISAAFSSFGFWMGYLMPEHAPIFVIRKILPSTAFPTLDSLLDLPSDWMSIADDWLLELNKLYKA